MIADRAVLLRALAAGETLKVHRDIDGRKVGRLHPLDVRPARPVDFAAINALKDEGLLQSNMKFPAATYLLTDKGRAAAAALTDDDIRPLGPREFDH